MSRLIDFRDGLRVGGHPLHAILIHFPMAFWMAVFPLELAGAWSGWDVCWGLAYTVNAAGLVLAVPAALAGLPELLALAKRPKESGLANAHMLVMVGAMGIFALELYLRHGAAPPGGSMRIVILALSSAGLLLLMAGGWLGGELVFRYGAGREQKK